MLCLREIIFGSRKRGSIVGRSVPIQTFLTSFNAHGATKRNKILSYGTITNINIIASLYSKRSFRDHASVSPMKQLNAPQVHSGTLVQTHQHYISQKFVE